MKQWLRSVLRFAVPPGLLNRFNAIYGIEKRLLELESRIARLGKLAVHARYPELFADPPDTNEFGIFSQNGEDGILLDILSQLRDVPRRSAEIGVQTGWECNTAILAWVLGWDVLMIEADPLCAAAAQTRATSISRSEGNRVEIAPHWVTTSNINRILENHHFVGRIGVLSIDVDGVDYWLWKAIRAVNADVVVIEYNATLGEERSITVPYDPRFESRKFHPDGYYGGASLLALERLGISLGYSLVAVDTMGVNAFFIHESKRPASLPVRTARQLYRPHALRARVRTTRQQWDEIAHLPFETV